jgi:hypothetical protein
MSRSKRPFWAQSRPPDAWGDSQTIPQEETEEAEEVNKGEAGLLSSIRLLSAAKRQRNG